MSADTDRLMSNARVHLPGATDANLQLEFYNVLNDFFQVTNAWQEDFSLSALVGVTSYTVGSAPSGLVSTINRLMRVVNSDNITVKAIMSTPGTITLKYAPSVVDTYTATLALTVDDPVDGSGFPQFPAWVLNKYNTGILDGLLARLMAQPAKPYTNPQLALVRAKSYIAMRSNAKAEVLHGNLNNGQTWAFPQTFRTRHQRF